MSSLIPLLAAQGADMPLRGPARPFMRLGDCVLALAGLDHHASVTAGHA
jgi:hypothetical protein